MLSLRKPSPEAIRCYLAAQAKLEFTYAAVAAPRPDAPPNGYVVDHTRVQLGEGEAAFKAARRALEQWEQFRLGWLEAWPADTPIRAGETVAIIGASNARVVPECEPNCLYARRSWAGSTIWFCLRHAARSCGIRRRTIHD